MKNKDHIFAFYTISKQNEKNKIKYFSDLPTLFFSARYQRALYPSTYMSSLPL